MHSYYCGFNWPSQVIILPQDFTSNNAWRYDLYFPIVLGWDNVVGETMLEIVRMITVFTNEITK